MRVGTAHEGHVQGSGQRQVGHVAPGPCQQPAVLLPPHARPNRPPRRLRHPAPSPRRWGLPLAGLPRPLPRLWPPPLPVLSPGVQGRSPAGGIGGCPPSSPPLPLPPGLGGRGGRPTPVPAPPLARPAEPPAS